MNEPVTLNEFMEAIKAVAHNDNIDPATRYGIAQLAIELWKGRQDA